MQHRTLVKRNQAVRIRIFSDFNSKLEEMGGRKILSFFLFVFGIGKNHILNASTPWAQSKESHAESSKWKHKKALNLQIEDGGAKCIENHCFQRHESCNAIINLSSVPSPPATREHVMMRVYKSSGTNFHCIFGGKPMIFVLLTQTSFFHAYFWLKTDKLIF